MIGIVGIVGQEYQKGNQKMLISIIDSFLGPIQTILTNARDHLNNISLVAGRGLNLDYYLGPISMLGPGWSMLIGSIISSSFLILVVLMARKGYGLYLALKEGVKWW